MVHGPTEVTLSPSTTYRAQLIYVTQLLLNLSSRSHRRRGTSHSQQLSRATGKL